ncbi:hypothetical protein Sjap_015838 [Stephania japonica]|uniref:Uncharacterized protein n=1 Tax=Stephania japonica TaxID=461633 RepID=A0AAP0NUD2_9MAGN
MASSITAANRLFFRVSSDTHDDNRLAHHRQRFKLGFCGFDYAVRRGCGLIGRSSCSGLSARRKQGSEGFEGFEGSGDLCLEAGILEFMQKSGNPGAFPSKKELIEAGRGDLVEGIVRQGGWLSLGWDVDGDEDIVGENGGSVQDFLDSVSGGAKDDGNVDGDLRYFDGDDRIFEVGIVDDDSMYAGGRIKSSAVSSSSGRGEKVENDVGIEGILSRLEKERNLSFGICSGEKQDKVHALVRDNHGDSQLEISTDSEEMGGIYKPDMWRKWSTQRAGFSESEFEAAEIGEQVSTKDATYLKNSNTRYAVGTEANITNKEKGNNKIRSRIKDLESELTSVLHVLRSRRDRTVSDKVLDSALQTHETHWLDWADPPLSIIPYLVSDKENPLEELHKLSDAWEFQETEVMHAQDKLRSIRAKLAVLEGKMTLAIVDAQKVVELKQKKINDAQKALSLLRTACIVWPNPGNEVLLSGSFDGWTSQV